MQYTQEQLDALPDMPHHRLSDIPKDLPRIQPDQLAALWHTYRTVSIEQHKDCTPEHCTANAKTNRDLNAAIFDTGTRNGLDAITSDSYLGAFMHYAHETLYKVTETETGAIVEKDFNNLPKKAPTYEQTAKHFRELRDDCEREYQALAGNQPEYSPEQERKLENMILQMVEDADLVNMLPAPIAQKLRAKAEQIKLKRALENPPDNPTT